MPTPQRPTRLRALLIGIRAPGLKATRVVEHVRRRLMAMVPGMVLGEDLVILDSPKTTRRAAILSALEEWKEGAERGVPHLVYYFGHGGRATFSDIPEGGDRVVHYLSCAPEADGTERLLFLRELSRHLAELHEACGNVTAILDSCYSGAFRAEPASPEVWSFEESPKWAKEALHRSTDGRLAAEGHPEVVRLLGASPTREAIAADLRVEGELIPGVGLFTSLLLRQLKELGDDWHRTSWEMLAHGLRQRVISKAGNESQWISLAGPQRRLLLSTARAQRSHAVGVAAFEGQHWIRAGQITGVEVGDEWALVGPLVRRGASGELEYEPQVSAEVEAVASNLARLAPFELPDEGPDPIAAVLTGVSRRMAVSVEGSEELRARLTQTAWLEAGGGRHRLCADAEHIHVEDREGEWGLVRFAADDDGQRKAFELLEDRARSARLLSLVGGLPASPKPSPIEWTVGVEDAVVAGGALLSPGSALWVQLRNVDAESGNWFVSVVLIDAIGRPVLLNSSQVDGVELDEGTQDYIGRRLGAARRGLVFDWPKGIVERGTGRLRLVMLASKRPIQLGHLIQVLPNSRMEALRMQGLKKRSAERGERAVYRSGVKTELPGRTMVTSEGWAAEGFELVLRAPGLG